MHLRRPWIALCLLAASAAGAAVVYKWTDADGVVHFSDTAVPGAEKIVTSSGSSNGINAGPTRAPNLPSNQSPTGGEITEIAIDSPGKEQVFFGDDVVPIHLHLVPGLSATQAITWHLNGKQLDQAPNVLSFSLQTLSRGTYAVAATVTDQATGASKSSESVTFYVRQPSELAPQHKK